MTRFRFLRLVAVVCWSVTLLRAHVHIEVVYGEGQLRLTLRDFEHGEMDPASVPLRVGSAAARPIPPTPAWVTLLGEASSTIWLIPQHEQSGLPWLGIGASSIRSDDFHGPLSIALVETEGPGDFVLFTTDPLGQPELLLSTRDGLTARDVLTLSPGAHLHANWAFTAPGPYRLRFVALGSLRVDNSVLQSEAQDYFVLVEAPPRPLLHLIPRAGDRIELTLEALPDLHYVVEHSPDLTRWLVLTNLVALSPISTHLVAVPPLPSQFFRVRLR